MGKIGSGYRKTLWGRAGVGRGRGPEERERGQSWDCGHGRGKKGLGHRCGAGGPICGGWVGMKEVVT